MLPHRKTFARRKEKHVSPRRYWSDFPQPRAYEFIASLHQRLTRHELLEGSDFEAYGVLLKTHHEHETLGSCLY
jgi:hypothetical protein